MRHNPTIQNTALIAWDGAAATPRRADTHLNFGIVFEYVGAANTAAPAVFNLFTYDALATDPCKPDLATKKAFNTVPQCVGAVGTPATITIPAGTKPNSTCGGGIACVPGKFVGVEAVSGPTADFRGVVLMTGKIGH